MAIQSFSPEHKPAFAPANAISRSQERIIRAMLDKADITIGGNRPHDMQIHHADFYQRILRYGSLGLGESYMDGWWDCAAIDSMITHLLQARIDQYFQRHPHLWWQPFRAHLFNPQSQRRAYQVAKVHYNLGNDLFTAMLDPLMCYSCAYWKQADTLEQAQINKLELACRKLDLQPGEQVLDIGCGWGSFAQYAAMHNGVNVTGVTVSREQAALARECCRDLPVNIQLCDYRKTEGQFDKVVSIGMFEHVGLKNYPTYFQVAQQALKPTGIFLLHTIGTDQSVPTTDPWIERYIFPNGKIPSLVQIAKAAEPYFMVEDVQNFGPDYDTTLMAWKQRFEVAWPQLRQHYDERFRRMWIYYLSICAGAFRSGQLQLYQVVLRQRAQTRSRYDAPR